MMSREHVRPSLKLFEKKPEYQTLFKRGWAQDAKERGTHMYIYTYPPPHLTCGWAQDAKERGTHMYIYTYPPPHLTCGWAQDAKERGTHMYIYIYVYIYVYIL